MAITKEQRNLQQRRAMQRLREQRRQQQLGPRKARDPIRKSPAKQPTPSPSPTRTPAPSPSPSSPPPSSASSVTSRTTSRTTSNASTSSGNSQISRATEATGSRSDQSSRPTSPQSSQEVMRLGPNGIEPTEPQRIRIERRVRGRIDTRGVDVIPLRDVPDLRVAISSRALLPFDNPATALPPAVFFRFMALMTRANVRYYAGILRRKRSAAKPSGPVVSRANQNRS